MSLRTILIGLFCLCSALRLDAADPFGVAVNTRTNAEAGLAISVVFTVPQGFHVYAKTVSIKAEPGIEMEKASAPEVKSVSDPATGEMIDAFDSDFKFEFLVRKVARFNLTVAYQGCNESTCFLPVTRTFPVGLPAVTVAPTKVDVSPPDKSDWQTRIKSFKVVGQAVGYIESGEFVRFLDESVSGKAPAKKDSIINAFESGRFFLAFLLVLAGGFLLNLTPCVLPMIPINIAIIGAGSGGGSRVRGFVLGSVYGMGMAAVYGALGLVVVVTGSRFGLLNASPVFNLAIAIVFLVMALSMFGLFNLDFSALQSRVRTGSSGKGSPWVAFFLGGVSALLAGACVAPVVISVLVLSADLYSKGNIGGLALPFVLGLGMALPWPLAGAGMSFLPKPGKWMDRVKIGFGLVILTAAIWYGKLGVSLALDNTEASKKAVASAYEESSTAGWLTDLDKALLLAEKEKKPVFIDFWASWCKNCLKMESTTFNDPLVRQKFEGFIRVKYRAENPGEPETRSDLDYFKVQGLPTYVVLQLGGNEK